MNTDNLIDIEKRAKDLENDIVSYKLEHNHDTDVKETKLRCITLKYKIRCQFDQNCLDIIFNDKIIRTLPELEDFLEDDRYTYCDIDEFKNLHFETAKIQFFNNFKGYTFNCLTEKTNLNFFYKLRSDAMTVRIIANGQEKIESFFFNKIPVIPECLEQRYKKLFRAHEKFKNLLKFKTTKDFTILKNKNPEISTTSSSRSIRMIFDQNEMLNDTDIDESNIKNNIENSTEIISDINSIRNPIKSINYDLSSSYNDTKGYFNESYQNNEILSDYVDQSYSSINRTNNTLGYDQKLNNAENVALYTICPLIGLIITLVCLICFFRKKTRN